jgi:hypothetical protein
VVSPQSDHVHQAQELARIFVKKVTWQDGSAIRRRPVGELVHRTASRATYAAEGWASSLDVACWQQAIYSGTGSPPEVKNSDADVPAFSRQAGGVGCVSAAWA